MAAEVVQGLLGRRHQQPVVPRHLDIAAVHDQPRPAARSPAGNRDVDARRPGGEEGPEVRGGLVGEHGVVAHREEGGDAAGAERQRLVADGVDAAELPDQRAAFTRRAITPSLEPER